MTSWSTILLFLNLTTVAIASDLPPPQIFSSPVWYDGDTRAALPQALNGGLVRYTFLGESSNTLDLRLDFETALRAWLNSLGLNHVRIAEVSGVENTDLILHYGPERMADIGSDPTAIHYRTQIFTPGRVLSVIDLDSNAVGLRWTTIGEAIRHRARIEVLHAPNGKIYNLTAGDIFGTLPSPERIVADLAQLGIKARDGGLAALSNGTREIAYWTLLHELGHAFGLGDQYARDGVELPASDKTVMSNALYRPMLPTALDRARVQHHIKASNLCRDLLLK